MSADNPLNQGWEFGSDPLENRCGSIPNFLLHKRGIRAARKSGKASLPAMPETADFIVTCRPCSAYKGA